MALPEPAWKKRASRLKEREPMTFQERIESEKRSNQQAKYFYWITILLAALIRVFIISLRRYR